LTTRNRASALLGFLGGAGTVTGSRFLVESGASRVLVDCGLFQGLKPLRLRNWEPFPVDPASIDSVLLTHAHVDHSGYLPALWRSGFRGRVLASEGTAELCRIVLRDSGRLHEEEAAYANRKGYSEHDPAMPLYTESDAEEVLGRFEVVPYGTRVDAAEGVQACLRPAGHILGSAVLELTLVADGVVITFSGDLGRPRHPVLAPPAAVGSSDAVVVESTYGDRSHADLDARDRFAKAIARTAGRGGVAVIPAFAVDRTEVVLLALRQLAEDGRIPRVPVYVDSPMALAALEVYRRAIRDGWEEIRPNLRGKENPFDTGTLVESHSVEDSRAINDVEGPAIIISASGMATGGRVLHHLNRRLPEPRNAVILVGYQAIGTRGRRLLEGESVVRMLGRQVPVHAEIVDISAFSVHADRDEIVAWLARAEEPPGTTFVVHGEPDASRALEDAIARKLRWPVVTPQLGDRVPLEARKNAARDS
jgi:metallo-beta-lactamase family protein